MLPTNKISQTQITDLIERLIYRIKQQESMGKEVKNDEKENITSLEAKHDELKEKARAMFSDLELDEEFKVESDKKGFSGTQLINFQNQNNMKDLNT